MKMQMKKLTYKQWGYSILVCIIFGGMYLVYHQNQNNQIYTKAITYDKQAQTLIQKINDIEGHIKGAESNIESANITSLENELKEFRDQIEVFKKEAAENADYANKKDVLSQHTAQFEEKFKQYEGRLNSLKKHKEAQDSQKKSEAEAKIQPENTAPINETQSPTPNTPAPELPTGAPAPPPAPTQPSVPTPQAPTAAPTPVQPTPAPAPAPVQPAPAPQPPAPELPTGAPAPPPAPVQPKPAKPSKTCTIEKATADGRTQIFTYPC